MNVGISTDMLPGADATVTVRGERARYWANMPSIALS